MIEFVVIGVAVLLIIVALAMVPRPTLVYPWQHALLYTDGKFVGVLPAGKHRLWALFRKHEIHRLQAGPNYFPGPLVDVLSADRFALRMSAWIVYEVTDPRTAFETNLSLRVSNSAQAALIVTAADRTLEALLAERGGLGELIAARIGADNADCSVKSAVISGLTLPPEIRRLVVEVERAKLEGLAALERARGEHAALRSLANAARLMKDNPELMSLRTLQALGKGSTLVLGQGALPVGGKT